MMNTAGIGSRLYASTIGMMYAILLFPAAISVCMSVGSVQEEVGHMFQPTHLTEDTPDDAT